MTWNRARNLSIWNLYFLKNHVYLMKFKFSVYSEIWPLFHLFQNINKIPLSLSPCLSLLFVIPFISNNINLLFICITELAWLCFPSPTYQSPFTIANVAQNTSSWEDYLIYPYNSHIFDLSWGNESISY